MVAKLIDGNALSKKIRSEIFERTKKITASKGQKPGLAVVLVGDNPASQVYVSSKVKACGEVGFHSVLERYPASYTEQDLLKRIDTLNNDRLPTPR